MAERRTENIQPEFLEEAVKRVHPQTVRLEGTGPCDRCLRYRTARGELKDRVDKVKVAREVAGFPADLRVLDLKQMMTKLVQFIRDSNDFVESES